MDRVVDVLSSILQVVLDAFRTLVSGAVSLVDWPASVIGIPPEILAVAIFCVVLLALWRSMGGYLS